MQPIYDPHEDSYLLLKHVPKYARGNVLDMGTGSGVIAIEAAQYAKEVSAVDINPAAVAYVKKQVERQELRNLSVTKSDLFQNVKGRFDTIFFNPPYLPDDPRLQDLALDGGKQGYEVIQRFLEQAKRHLKADGVVLLLFSSLSKPKKIYQLLRANGYKYQRLSRLKLDFEELYVYEIRTQNLSGPRKKRHRLRSRMERKKSSRERKKSKKRSP